MNEEQIAGFPVIPICARRDKLRWQDDTRESGFFKAETLDAPL